MSQLPDTPSPSHDAPLTMTVHSLPTPGEPTAQRRIVGRWKLLAVLLVCASPVIASYFTYYVLRPEGRSNYGELMNPQRPAPDVAVLSASGSPVRLTSLKGQWLLVSVAGAACGPVCEKHVYLQRQLRETLGREKDRLDRVWLVTDDAPIVPALLSQVDNPQAGATALRIPQATLAQWLEPASGQALQDHLYVVDPLGNWIMRFPVDIDTAKAKRDLERLLRASASWDRAGREQPAGS